MVSAKAFQVQMAQCKAYEKTVTAQRLNRAGASKIQYAVGDRVKFYLPPSQAQAQKAGRNPKHLLHWAGPGLLTKSLSTNGTTWRIKCGNTFYERHVMNMRKWNGPTPAVPMGIIRDDNIMAGSLVAVLDSEGDKHYHIARVLEVGGQVTKLWYACTKAKILATARWKFMYRNPDNYRSDTPVYTLSRNVLNPEDFRYTSTIDTLDIGDSLIIVANLAMRPNPRHPYNGVLSAGSIQLLQDTNLRHHQIRKTWNFQG